MGLALWSASRLLCAPVTNERGPTEPENAMSDSDEKAFARQQQIWTALYGPRRASTMLESAKSQRLAAPGGNLADVFRSVEPDDDDDVDEAGTMRPGFG